MHGAPLCTKMLRPTQSPGVIIPASRGMDSRKENADDERVAAAVRLRADSLLFVVVTSLAARQKCIWREYVSLYISFDAGYAKGAGSLGAPRRARDADARIRDGNCD